MADHHVNVTLESREQAFAACCWYLHTLDPGAEAVAQVANSRDPFGRKVVFLANSSAPSTVFHRGQPIDYAVHTGPTLAGDPKPETARALRLRGRRSDVESLVCVALDEHRAFLAARGGARAGEPGEEVPYWTWDEDAACWTRAKPRRARPLSTLFLPPDADALVADFRHFCSEESLRKYRDLHVSPSRVYMLHGTPGSGKSSLVHCVASETGFGVAAMAFGPGVTDADVAAALSRVPARCVVCIEDIDCVFEGRKAAAGTCATFGGLLAALDGAGGGGATAGEGNAVFLTTNRLCVLDPALRRRVDHVLEFGHATKAQARRLFSHFFPHSLAFEQFWQRAHGRQFSMSALQKFLVKTLQSGDPMREFEHFEALVTCVAEPRDVAHMYA